MELSDYDGVILLWQASDGVQLRDADSKLGIKKYLNRNPGLSFVALKDDVITGSIMSGHDGKRGYVQHLAVSPECRRSGIATELLSLCLEALKVEGIVKSHIHVLDDNQQAKAYWSNRGWSKRSDIQVFSFINGGHENT